MLRARALGGLEPLELCIWSAPDIDVYNDSKLLSPLIGSLEFSADMMPENAGKRYFGHEIEEDSDSEDESEMSDDEKGRDTKAKSRFIHNSDSEDDDSDEDVKRVVKSAQAKRLEEMEASGKLMDNALKINDWVAISTGVWTVSFLPVALLTR